nr:hypothetical protein BaRGS_023015 [Batillaria attramentaria]
MPASLSRDPDIASWEQDRISGSLSFPGDARPLSDLVLTGDSPTPESESGAALGSSEGDWSDEDLCEKVGDICVSEEKLLLVLEARLADSPR